MSQSRRSGGRGVRPAGRPPTSRSPEPEGTPPTAVARGWGYNVDYLVAARFGGAVPAFIRRLLNATEQGESDCRDLGRRVPLTRDRHRAAQQFATAFWLFVVFAAIALLAVVVIGVGVVNHRLLGSAPGRVITSVIIAVMALAMAATLFAGIRKRWLDDSLLRRRSRREVPGLANPKPYDWVISVAAGLLTFAGGWLDGAASH